MDKIKKLQHENMVEKQQLHGIKNSSIKKNEDSKFKHTPKGKATLINELKAQGNCTPSQEASTNAKDENQNLFKTQTSSSNAKQSKQGSPNGKQNFPSKGQKLNKTKINSKKMEEQFDDFSSDIDERIVPQKDVSIFSSVMYSSYETVKENSDIDTPDIFGKSLRDELNEDKDFEKVEDEAGAEDEDVKEEEDDDSDEEVVQHKCIKMFEGLQSKTTIDDDEEDLKEDDDDNDDEQEEDDDSDDNGVAAKFDEATLIALARKVMVDDEDEDFNEDEDEDDDISSKDEDDKENINAITKAYTMKKEKVATKRKADEAFNKKDEKATKREEKARRFLFVRNIPKGTPIDTIKSLFGQYGVIKMVDYSLLDCFQRARKDPRKPTWPTVVRMATVEPTRTVVGNILYETQESALKATKELHGTKLFGNYLSVMTAHESRQPIVTAKTVFLLNLKRGIEENEIWKTFGKCGRIKRLVLICDLQSEPIEIDGYVTFDSKDAVHLALELNDTKIMGQPLMVVPCPKAKEVRRMFIESLKRDEKQGIKRILSHKDDNKPQKKFKNNSEKFVTYNANILTVHKRLRLNTKET